MEGEIVNVLEVSIKYKNIYYFMVNYLSILSVEILTVCRLINNG